MPADSRPPIRPNPPRWTPAADPSTIDIPGLDTNASVNDQIEQIEQLITIKLQNIDENFSKMHNILANQMLPAVKRYAVGTEPVREAAKFWTSFYEQAAQIRIPTFEDYSSVNEAAEETQGESSRHSEAYPDETHDHQPDEQSVASSEDSFMPNQAAFSSTPATAHRQRLAQPHNSFASHASDDPSWSASLESPLVRIDRELQKFSLDETATPQLPAPSFHHQQTPSMFDDSQEQEQSMIPRSDKGKGKEVPRSLLRNVLKSTVDPSIVSPLKLRKPKTPVPKGYNPYLPPNTKPSEWSGLVDLSDPSSRTPQRYRRGAGHTSAIRSSTPDQDDDDSFDGLPPGMSPPRLMSPARPPRSTAELGLGRTPVREAASRISRDIVFDMQRQTAFSGYKHSIVESSMSTVPTPPSLSRYAMQDTTESSMASLDTMMRRVGLSTAAEAVMNPQQHEEEDMMTPIHSREDTGSDSDDDDDEINNTAHPSAAFLMASRARGADDSFGSSNHSGDSFEDEVGGDAPIHPFAGSVEDDGFDDSFDDDSFGGNMVGGVATEETETVFGVLPAQRQAGYDGQQFRMLGEDLLQDTIGFTGQMGPPGGVAESPTPANWGSTDR
ncbi:DASH complex subunit ask1 [Pleurotus pulmonarius]|nr:DASH complex subunit ask1 [Pleurotus pulmonarius]